MIDQIAMNKSFAICFLLMLIGGPMLIICGICRLEKPACVGLVAFIVGGVGAIGCLVVTSIDTIING